MTSQSKARILNRRGQSTHLKCLGFVCLYIPLLMTPVWGYALRSCRISRGRAACNNQDLVTVPQDIPPTVVTIDLSKNKISRIKMDDFDDFSVLTELDLNRNVIHLIDTGAFSALTSLKMLNLNNNHICHLPEDVFLHLKSLVELRINYNCITNVSPDTFKPLTFLNYLDVSNNKLNFSNVPIMLQHLPRLRELVIKANDLNTFHFGEIEKSSLNLSSLDLSNNPIDGFNVSADVFPNLTWLTIGSTVRGHEMVFNVRNKTFLRHVDTLDISSISMSLIGTESLLQTVNSSLICLRMNAMKRNLYNLIDISCTIPTMTELQIRENKLSHINSQLFKLCMNLTELDLAQNKIKTITDDAFKTLQSLAILNLSFNKLSTVPAATRNLSSLKVLDLSHGRISALQCEDFENSTELKELKLYNNTISDLKSCLFTNLRKLQILELQSNNIITINNTFKASLPNLKKLQLNQNKIQKIEGKDFEGLSSLRNLSLHDNQIVTLHKDCFFGLTNLTHLLLGENLIEEDSLKRDLFHPLVHLRRLDLSNNHIKFKNDQPLPFPPFSKLSRLEDLSLDSQNGRGRTFLPVNVLQGLSSLLSFGMRNSQLHQLDNDTFKWTPRLQMLDLRSNPLRFLFPELFFPLRDLRQIYISNSELQSLDFFIAANLSELVYLQAMSNQYSVIREAVINSLPALVYADLRGNSFTCDCDNMWMITWAENSTKTQVYDAYNLECNYPPSFRGKKILDFDLRSCSVDLGLIAFITTTTLTLVLLIVPFTFHFMRWQLVYTYYIFLAWLTKRKHKKKQAPYEYDAFVSYNTHDEPWVIRELLPKLEGEQGWRLCLHHRDFEPGKPIIENITDAIYQSRKTLCVISHRYLESEWCSREIQAASFRLFDEKKDVLILVFLEEIPSPMLSPYYRMRKLLKRQTYLSWTKVAGKTELFWEKLRQAMQSGDEQDEGLLHPALNVAGE